MALQSHVPKFGNWESENVPYTAYFEKARREKIGGGGSMINPNDPIENLDAFNMSTSVAKNNVDEVKNSHHESSLKKGNHKVLGNNNNNNNNNNNTGRHNLQHRSRGSQGSSIGSFSSSSHNRHRSRSHSFNNHVKQNEATAIPKFGGWDMTDPKSGEGYSAIFSKIKEERHATSSSHSISTPPLNNYSNIKNQFGGSSSRLSKYCCCLF